MLKFIGRRLGGAIVAASLAGFTCSAGAEEYPTSLVKVIVPFPPGGVYDLYARMATEHLTKALGQQFVVQNSPGGQGALGSQLVAKARPDGYTLLMGGQATHATNPHLFRDLKFDALRDFEPVSLIALVGNVLVVNPALPATNVRQFIAYAKEHPGKVAFSHAGAGTSMSIAGELFKQKTGANLLSVPYRGSALAANAVAAGEVQAMFANTISVISQLRAGTVRALGVTTTSRQELIPEVPPIAEQGVSGYEIRSWFGLFAPAGTPKWVVDKLNAEIGKMVRLPEYERRIHESGAVVEALSPGEFAAFLKRDFQQIGQVVREAGLKADVN